MPLIFRVRRCPAIVPSRAKTFEMRRSTLKRCNIVRGDIESTFPIDSGLREREGVTARIECQCAQTSYPCHFQGDDKNALAAHHGLHGGMTAMARNTMGMKLRHEKENVKDVKERTTMC
jgi:hypothetical protein